MTDNHNKWVACWGNATSITDRREARYAKDLTLRYPIQMPFDGSQLRFRFSNLTGTEPVTLTKVFVNHTPITFDGEQSVSLMPGTETQSDAITLAVKSGDMITVSLYLADYTQMNSGTLITGPLSHGYYAYGDYAEQDELPLDLSRRTNWFYFLNTIDVLTSDRCRAVVCYGDSITAQSWPDYLAQKLLGTEVAVIRRAVSGTRILRQYDCITYQAYGLKGATRFPIEMRVSGATDVIIQHGINDIIHPVGTDVNPFRPWSDLPTVEELMCGVEDIYVKPAKAMGLRVWSGTLLPIEGWRTYNDQREQMRQQFNEWLRTSSIFYGCVDFDAAVRDAANPKAFAAGFDSGDHLHPSEPAYEAMASAAIARMF
ncbi:GDSL-type esterase/lipase family protein [Prevotella sp. E13-17]|uniref:GDSL-type esterase/lipase family protein n=1 Tax=Prevotella sp. E13-17 TaxID=2913616 RepID=UPI001EDBC3F1|nr:GDSL-type esterase/lipase family protein [Prevotella sp. E13-17]UKK52177.1 GDSL-type esterase/lipase family protein [Prevotella sp. E13-17]